MVSPTRDRRLADELLRQVRACAQSLAALLICTDGWNAYPGSICRAFREKVKQTAGQGRARLVVWPQLVIATVIKRTEKKRVVVVTRKLKRGIQDQAEALLEESRGGRVLNTAFIECLNGTMRERLATLTHKCRHAASRVEGFKHGMYLIGCTYNLCWPHQELSKATHKGSACTPAMTSGLTDHVWSVRELLTYKVAPPPWVKPKRRGRPPKGPRSQPAYPQRGRLRLRKGILCSVTD